MECSDSTGSPGNYVKIEISRNGGSSWFTLAASTPNNGTFPWTVTGPGSNNCLIRITSTTNLAVTDTSDRIFSIPETCDGHDIRVQQMTSSKSSIRASETTTITGLVGNLGLNQETSVPVSLTVVGPGGYACSLSQTVSSISASTQTSVSFTWPGGSCGSLSTEGTYTVTMSAVSSAGCDKDFTNNQSSVNVYVGDGPSHKAYKVRVYEFELNQSHTVGSHTFTYTDYNSSHTRYKLDGSSTWYENYRSYLTPDNGNIFWLDSFENVGQGAPKLYLVIGSPSDGDGFTAYGQSAVQGSNACYTAPRAYYQEYYYRALGPETNFTLYLNRNTYPPYGTPATSGNNLCVDTAGLNTGTYRLAILTDKPGLDQDEYVTFGLFDVTAPEINVKQGSTSIPDDTGSVLFGSVNVGASSPLTFTIEDTGSAALLLTGSPRVVISGANPSDFVVTQIPSSPIGTGASTTFVVSFLPSAGGPRTATLSIANNDSNESTYNFTLTGTGTAAPEIDVRVGLNSIPSGGTYNFGAAAGSKPVVFTIENTGNAPLNLTDSPPVSVTGANSSDFVVNVQPWTPVAAFGGLTTFVVTFTPLAVGQRIAALSIGNNDSDEDPYPITLTGSGTAPILGHCGSADGGTFPSKPTTDLCSAGNPSAVTGSGPWFWSCTGTETFAPVNCSAQKSSGSPTWTQKADFGGTARTFAAGFSIGTKGYVGMGQDASGSTFYSDFWEYDPSGNQWTQKANFGGTGRVGAVGFSIGTKGYVGTGYDGSSSTTDFYEYNPASNQWTKKADFIGTARWGAVAFSIGGKGYVGTGNAGSYEKDFYEYDPGSNAWTRKKDFGGSATYLAVGFSIGGKGYLGTGAINRGVLNAFYEYDPAADQWTPKADFGGTARYGAVGFSMNGKGYVGTGWDGSSNTNTKDFWEYDPSTDNWTQTEDFGGTKRSGAVGFAIGAKGYAGMGYDGACNKDFWEFDPFHSLLYAHFAGHGLYTWNGTAWTRIGDSQPTIMAASSSLLYATFLNVNGIFEWDGTAWTKIGDTTPTSMTVSGSILYAYFPEYGLYKWDGTTWTKIGESLPTIMAGSGSALYAHFAGHGLYTWNGTAWTWIGESQPTIMAGSGSALHAHFAGHGLYAGNGTAWTWIGESQPTIMAASSSMLYATFLGVNSIFERDGTTWTKIGDTTPTSMVSGSILYAYFAGYGLYKWDGHTWTKIGESEPTIMAGSGS